ncbi:PucR family transcriptional regulator [Streptomyces sp. AK02-01A]|uniref:PucR family transcriptional regulator n=1 Tax=Streptomyces sp. AK02-01A TaxID=3028648 RepID=UPI0029A89F8A|nr:helix-turn-helix domain-containing protein [Streptomyces sp. AK02-01A]MDX3852762.1 helix-turn-helix domain-containing protein [Streptomyces sp. AK02-01A]
MDVAPFTALMPFPLAPPRDAAPSILLRLTTAMLDGADEYEVLRAATAAISTVGPFTTEAAYFVDDGSAQRRLPRNAAASGAAPSGIAAAADRLERRISALDGRSGRLNDHDGSWMWALALRHGDRCLGYLVVRARTTPSAEEAALADLLARQAGIALANLAGRRAGRRHTEEYAGPEADKVPDDFSGAALAVLERQSAFSHALSRVAASGSGVEGILRILHEHTGLPALTEDLFGNPRAWAGPVLSGPVARRRDEPLPNACRLPGVLRDGERLIAPVEMAGDLLGLVVLVDPDRRAAQADIFALEQAGLVLAPELSHERVLIELEPQLRHDLVEKLISGRATEDVFARAAAFGHDLRRPNRVALLQWPGSAEQATVGEAVGRAARRLRLDVLVGSQRERTVVLVAGLESGDALYRAVSEHLGTPDGAVGVGGRCDGPADLPHSYEEAVRALTVRRGSHDPRGSTDFEELGLYRMMGTGNGEREADRFVREWLGALLDYDSRHHTNLVTTLSRYLESGGSYDAASDLLCIHRSTLRYRLQRIREITGHDLSVVETRLNLHVATRIRNVLAEPP